MKIYIHDDTIDKYDDYISCMATMPSNNKPKFIIGVYESGVFIGEPYLKIYSADRVLPAIYVTRLSLRDGHRIRHTNRDGKLEWEDINNKTLQGLNKYLQRQSSFMAGYTNWQVLIYLWNNEVGIFTNQPPKKYKTFIEAFFDGYYDTEKNLSNPNYMKSDAVQPDFRKDGEDK